MTLVKMTIHLKQFAHEESANGSFFVIILKINNTFFIIIMSSSKLN